MPQSNQDNPLLADWTLPPFAGLKPRHAVPAVESVIADGRARVAGLRDAESPDYEALVMPMEALGERLHRVFSPIGHLNAVTSTAGWRQAHQECLARLTAFETELGQDEALYTRFQALARAPDFGRRPPVERKLVNDAVRDFRLSGVHLGDADKARFSDIMQRLSALGACFEEHVLDATDAWSTDVDDEARLAGLPADLVERAAGEADRPGWRLSLDMPTFLAVMHHGRDRSLRREFYEAWVTRASDEGPDAGRFDNSALMEETLAFRHEAARLVGYGNYAEYSLATKMAPSPEAVSAFLEDLAGRARPAARRQLDELAALARDMDGLERLEPWDVNYYGERLRERRYEISEEALRPYFPLQQVLDGLFDVAGRLFGVRIVEREGVESWHPDVRFFDVLGEDGEPVAGFYLDAYARAAKRSGAWMDVATNRCRLPGRHQLPVAYLTCNAAPPGESVPALFTHDEVVTLFHEFGHGLHHMLTRVDLPSLAGIEGVEWDAVELPSQFLENWCWQRESLDRFARHWRTGEPLPEELFEGLVASRRHLGALQMIRQLEFALFDLELHARYDPDHGGRVMETLGAVRERVAVVEHPDWNRFPHSFSHIFGGGYAAGYYSYLWAEMLAADAFGLFSERGVFDSGAGRAFRDEILAVGGSRPAMESFLAFRGREPEVAALLELYGIAA